MSRRTITIDEENEKNLNQLRGWLLTKKNTDLDYTRAVNMTIALGFNRISEGDLKPRELDIGNKYLSGSDLKIAALDDEHWNYWIENVYPKMMAKLQKLEKKSNSSVKRTKKEDVPEPK